MAQLCAHCGSSLHPGPPWAPGPGHRLAFDLHRGRLWSVCSGCHRWNLTPLELRWESLESCEEAVRKKGRILVSTPHLSLVAVEEGELIRVGEPPRTEFVDWRYGQALPVDPPKAGLWARLLSGLPPPPLQGYDPYGPVHRLVDMTPWTASPFLEVASPLTYLFSQVPLAPSCPSCRRPVALRPWEFQDIRLVPQGEDISLASVCGLCEEEVTVPLVEARPALRLALGVVTAPALLREVARGAAQELDSAKGARGLTRRLAREGYVMGELGPILRGGLLISLDEMAEAEALEAQWREAEELARIADGELTQVPGFEEFRRRVLSSTD